MVLCHQLLHFWQGSIILKWPIAPLLWRRHHAIICCPQCPMNSWPRSWCLRPLRRSLSDSSRTRLVPSGAFVLLFLGVREGLEGACRGAECCHYGSPSLELGHDGVTASGRRRPRYADHRIQGPPTIDVIFLIRAALTISDCQSSTY